MKDSIIDSLTHVGPYVMVKKIGKGLTGVVYEAVHYKYNNKVAIKIVDKKCLKHDSLLRVEKEVVLLKLICHPHVVELIDLYDDKHFLFIILEYASGGELFDYIVKRKTLHIDEARRFFRQMLSAVEFCHQHAICHRDLKPENLLLDENNSLKVADFGMASIQDKGNFMDTSCGSPHYASPEVISGDKYDGMKSDVWSMGVILYALLTGGLPFNDKAGNIPIVLDKIKKGQFKIPDKLPNDCKILLNGMIHVDVSKRMTIEQIKSNPWVGGGCSDCKENTEYTLKVINFEKESDIDLSLVKNIALIVGLDESTIIKRKLMVSGVTLEKSLYSSLLTWYKNYSSKKNDHFYRNSSTTDISTNGTIPKNTFVRSEHVDILNKNDKPFYSLGSPFDEPELLKIYNQHPKSTSRANTFTNCLDMLSTIGRKFGFSSETNKDVLVNDNASISKNSCESPSLSKQLDSSDNLSGCIDNSNWIRKLLFFENNKRMPLVFLVRNYSVDDLRRVLIRSLVIACKSHSFQYGENNTNHFLVELNSSKLLRKCTFSIRISQIDSSSNKTSPSSDTGWSYDESFSYNNSTGMIAVVFKHKFGSYDCFKKCVQHIEYIIKSSTENKVGCLDDHSIAHNFEQLNLSECEDHINDLYSPIKPNFKKTTKLSPVTCSPSDKIN